MKQIFKGFNWKALVRLIVAVGLLAGAPIASIPLKLGLGAVFVGTSYSNWGLVFDGLPAVVAVLGFYVLGWQFCRPLVDDLRPNKHRRRNTKKTLRPSIR